MKALFDHLFMAYCVPYDPNRFPDYLRKDPTRAYGQYAFEEGFKLALQLARWPAWTRRTCGKRSSRKRGRARGPPSVFA